MRVPLSLPLQDIIHDFCEITGLAESQCSAAQIDMISAVRHALDRRTRNNRSDEEEIKHLQAEKISLQNALNEEHDGYYDLDIHEVDQISPLVSQDLRIRVHSLRNNIKKLKQIIANQKNDDSEERDTPGIKYYAGFVSVRDTNLRNRNDILDIIYSPSKEEVSDDCCLPFGHTRASVF
jgi:hypothetical protein